MTDVSRLVSVAQQLAGRMREDDPDANGRWLLNELPDPEDRWALLFVLAAAVPDDVAWSVLTAWTRGDRTLRPHGTLAAVGRHRYHGEPLCVPCRELERQRAATYRRAKTGTGQVRAA